MIVSNISFVFSPQKSYAAGMTILIGFATFIATFLGGLFALRFKDRLHLVLGFSAGAVIGVAFFDLIPEAVELGAAFYDVSAITTFVAAGFIGYMILDRLVIIHRHVHDEDHDHAHDAANKNRGRLGAASLAVHSLLDGIAVGLAFQVSDAVGAIVTTAVLVHKFSDGINTINLVLKNDGNKKEALKWLAINAIAPMIGIASTLFFVLPESALSVILAVFAGFFLYIGASDLLPESHHSHPTFWTTFTTVLGVVVLYVAISIAGV
jgi:zinc transporter ZupT